jgi:pyruvate/2-oxoacid:ferredoxin oxidoreductase beta subunit
MTSVERPVMQKKDYKTDQEVRWCPGCGDYSILNAVQGALAAGEVTAELGGTLNTTQATDAVLRRL